MKKNNPAIYNSDDLTLIKNDRDRTNTFMEEIHASPYFSISRSKFKVSERKYLSNFLILKDKKVENVLKTLIKTDKVLIVDDCVTSGTTMLELINVIKRLNTECTIIIFSLINGKNNFGAEKEI